MTDEKQGLDWPGTDLAWAAGDLGWAEGDLAYALSKIRQNLATFKTAVPPPNSIDQVYPAVKNDDWTASFWIGMLQLAKEVTASQEFDAVIDSQLEVFADRLARRIGTQTHDLGFLYTLSALADYRLTGRERSRQMALEAARLLLFRYSDITRTIQAWGSLEDPAAQGRIIIDCLMNLPLLYQASGLTGDPVFAQAAYDHAKRTQDHILRADSSTFHTYFFDVATGRPLRGETAQGFSDDSCWARGQAWGIYGFTLSYLHTGDHSFLQSARRCADYFIDHLPADHVPYWDLAFTDGSGQERDSSAASIAACGLLELARQLPLADPDRAKYENWAVTILRSLSQGYTTRQTPASNGLLLHGVYNKNSNAGVDECTIWGDYYYVEALVRLTRSWQSYW